MSARPAQILLLGYGNPGRADDGLGPACVARLEALRLPGVDLHVGYQLVAEDAQRISDYAQVVFVDACLSGPETFRFDALHPRDQDGFGSHSLSPGGVLALCALLYGPPPKAWLLAIRGVEFDCFRESLSPTATRNLERALDFLQPWLGQQMNAQGTPEHA